MAKDYYSILGVAKGAADADIKKVYRKLAHEHHPDKQGGNETKFKEINEAYQVLGNTDKRRQYDQFGSNFGAHGGQSAGGFNWQDMSNAGANPFGGFSQGQTFDFGDLGDILGDFFSFGGTTGNQHSHAQRGSDIETTLSLTFDESYFGAEKKLSISAHHRCEHCDGKGFDPSSTLTTCSRCKGSGRLTVTRTTMLGSFRTESVCSDCNGQGKTAEKKCTVCLGQTRTMQTRTIAVKIPAGIDDGKSIRLAGKGEDGINGGPGGDLFVRLQIAEHPRFIRDGYDIKNKQEVPLSVLSNGDSVSVDTMTGPVQLKIPAGTTSGKIFLLKNKGFERLSGRGRGNQLVTVEAHVPSKLNTQQKKLLQQFEDSLRSTDPKKSWF